MNILCWNMEYWNNIEKSEWLNKCKNTLLEIIEQYNVDIVLLQEINPLKLFDINYIPNETHLYEDNKDGKKIIYHELSDELPKKYRKNLWGNSIIIIKSYKNFENNINYNDKNYFARKCLMSYTFEFDNRKITFINFYNKSNNGIYTMLDKYHYDIQYDIERITKQNDNLIIFAGDFNTGSNITDKNHTDRYYNLCNKLIGFVEISNGAPEYNLNTTYWYNKWSRKGHFLRNDFYFINDMKYIKSHSFNIPNINNWKGEGQNVKWGGISDHCPLILNLTFN